MASTKVPRKASVKAKRKAPKGKGRQQYTKGTKTISIYTRLKAFRAQLRVGDEACFKTEATGQHAWGRVARIGMPQRTIMEILVYTTLGEWVYADWSRITDVRTEQDEAIRLSWVASLVKKLEARRLKMEAENANDDY